jgi:20S proteasome alpha/beta subunit
MELQMFISSPAIFEDPVSFKFDGKGLHKSENYSFLGAGDSSVLRYLIEMLYSPEMKVESGINLALYLVQKAEDYIDGCGGPIDLGVMDWSDESCRMLAPEKIEEKLRSMEKQEPLMADLILKPPFSS